MTQYDTEIDFINSFPPMHHSSYSGWARNHQMHIGTSRDIGDLVRLRWAQVEHLDDRLIPTWVGLLGRYADRNGFKN